KELIDLTFAVGDHVKNLLVDEQLEKKENRSNQEMLNEHLNNFCSSKPAPVFSRSVSILPKKGVATWHIIFYPDENLIFRGINLSIILSDLSSIGNYRIESNIEDNVVSFWSIFIVTDKDRNAIEDILLFVLDNCKIVKVADYDIYNKESLQEHYSSLEESLKEKLDNTAEIKSIGLKINTVNSLDNQVASKSIAGRLNVDSSKLDTLMYLVTELVTAKSELLLSIRNGSELKILEAGEKIEKLTKLFSENALNIRLVPLQEMVSRFQRLIRDLSNQLGKKVSFSVRGGDTELDKNIVDALAEPVMHLIRNCIDHGIELPDKRLERGKPDTGVITFNAFKKGNNVYVEIGDDGNGIDADYVYRKAIDKGFLQEGTQLDTKAIYDLLFLPGFSTASSLTEVSGRGVGMDIVKKRIHEIRGEINIDSKKDVGTTFTIKLQQTISIIDTLLVESDNSIFAIPIEDVEACDIEEHDVIFNQHNQLVEYNNELVPYIYLREKFSSYSETLKREKLIIINRQDKKYIIIADKIIGQHQAAIKPLNETFQHVNFLSGASILGDGSIALLLDTDKLKNLIINQN
ncbi:MAG TPA: chemotaxis protein CheA, partial [Bacteroidales bacterium]|nr:chemotaxis protein CheA [Bacteroidales bacterium]